MASLHFGNTCEAMRLILRKMDQMDDIYRASSAFAEAALEVCKDLGMTEWGIGDPVEDVTRKHPDDAATIVAYIAEFMDRESTKGAKKMSSF